MGSIMSIVSIALAVLLVIGFLFGFARGWKKSLVRCGLLALCVVASLLLSGVIVNVLTDNFVEGLVLSAFGFTVDFQEVASEALGDIANDLLVEGSTVTKFATAMLQIAVKLIAFFLVFIVLALLTWLIYAIVSLIVSAKKKKKAVGKVKQKGWQRLIGGGVGIVGALVVCLALFTPVFGIMNVCDKFLEDAPTEEASAYTSSLVCGKFYTEDEKIGQIESALEKYDEIKKEYNNSFAGKVLTYTGVDFLGKATFTNLSTVTNDGLTVNLSNECVNLVNVYNLYKTNFVAKSFDITNNESVDAVKQIYNTAKKSEVLKNLLIDIVPKFAQKWGNNEKYLGFEMPLNGDTKDLVLNVLDVYNTDDFDVLDRNFSVLFDALKVANNNNVITAINGGQQITDVLDNGTFVKDEILALASTPEFKKALPNVMSTMIRFAYGTVIPEGDTAQDGLNQEFTAETIADIDWNNEATSLQVIVSKMMGLLDGGSSIDMIGEFGVVIDASRSSKILSKPTKCLVRDYIDLKLTGIDTAKSTILSAIDDNWDKTLNEYKFEGLFNTVQKTASIAENVSSMDLNNMQETMEMLIGEEGAAVRETIKDAIDDGILGTLLGEGNEEMAEAFGDIVTGILDGMEGSLVTAETIENDMAAGQVILNIINNQDGGEGSVLDCYGETTTPEEKEEAAKTLVETLGSSEAVIDVLDNLSGSSAIDGYVNGLSSEDTDLIKGAINDAGTTLSDEARGILKNLFGIL